MARIKFGSIVVSGSGSIGGQTIQNSSGGMQLRSKPIRKAKPSTSQYTNRRIYSILRSYWRDLSEDNKRLWGIFSESSSSGYLVFMQQNYYRLAAGETIILNPYSSGEIVLGDELVANPDFDTDQSWVSQSCWVFAPGYAYFDNSCSGTLRQSVVDYTPMSVRFEIVIILASGAVNLRINNASNRQFFDDSVPYPFNLGTGTHIFDTEISESSTNIKLFADSAGSSFGLDKFSIRPIL